MRCQRDPCWSTHCWNFLFLLFLIPAPWQVSALQIFPSAPRATKVRSLLLLLFKYSVGGEIPPSRLGFCYLMSMGLVQVDPRPSQSPETLFLWCLPVFPYIPFQHLSLLSVLTIQSPLALSWDMKFRCGWLVSAWSTVTLMCSDSTGFCLTVDAITVDEQPPQSCVPSVDIKAATVLQLEQTVLQNSGKGKRENSPRCCGSVNAAGNSKRRLLQPARAMLQTTEVWMRRPWCLVLGLFQRLYPHPCLERRDYHLCRFLLVC